MAADLLEELAKRWESRGLKSHPTDTMLINLHVRELRETMAALSESPSQQAGWLPIETAPNTDSPASIHVLVWLPEFGAHRGQYTKFYADTGEWPWSADLFSKLANKTITHWQPLPGSP